MARFQLNLKTYFGIISVLWCASKAFSKDTHEVPTLTPVSATFNYICVNRPPEGRKATAANLCHPNETEKRTVTQRLQFHL